MRAKVQVQAACCALVGELALDETNSYHIVNSNGVYLVASKLLITSASCSSSFSSSTISISNSSSSLNDSAGKNDFNIINSNNNKDIERLHCNVWRTLRILFITERHRPLIKKIIPFCLFEQFVDIGNYKKDIKLYQPLVESFYKLSVSFEYLFQSISSQKIELKVNIYLKICAYRKFRPVEPWVAYEFFNFQV
jgi:hypothetical protein